MLTLKRRDILAGGETVRIMDVQYSEDKVKVMEVTLKIEELMKRKIIVTYVPPKTNTWGNEEHKDMQ
ncbi:hypothetical protein E2C01_091292 [Portunus trituberculatus]|uniref:Uncharacterized protein n=1 Tax=Portunus trituberculatus TaxID=210409 RepID=A0A5B7JN66_PORTR|nr:hypothetical protein [Portunus trituberculatus]